MSLVQMDFACSIGHRFQAPDVSSQYGEFVMRGEISSAPALLKALEDPVFKEVGRLLADLGSYIGLSDRERADLLQSVFGLACDLAPDGTLLEIGRMAGCPVCGTRQMATWKPIGPYSGEQFLVSHASWNRLSNDEKRAVVAQKIELDRPA